MVLELNLGRSLIWPQLRVQGYNHLKACSFYMSGWHLRWEDSKELGHLGISFCGHSPPWQLQGRQASYMVV